MSTPLGPVAYEQERLVLWAQELICVELERAGMSKADLARATGLSRSYVTRVLGDNGNVTLHMLARLARGLKLRIKLMVVQAGVAP